MSYSAYPFLHCHKHMHLNSFSHIHIHSRILLILTSKTLTSLLCELNKTTVMKPLVKVQCTINLKAVFRYAPQAVYPVVLTSLKGFSIH